MVEDWLRTQTEPCSECDYDAATIPTADLGRAVEAEATAWADWLAAAADSAILCRPEPEIWSALEYACHVRDVLGLFRERIRLALAEDDPDVGWWDHEAAVTDEHYNAQSLDAVSRAIEMRGAALAATLRAVPDDGWERTCTRRRTERFTVAGLARFALHEAHHHRVDAARSEAACHHARSNRP